MDLYFYNTLTKKKDLFNPLSTKEVKIYSCGPTVYKNATIGNMRTNIFQDVLRRVLRYNNYKIKHAMNITDVGHLVSDGDEGEDKMLKSAREEHKTPLEIAEYYTNLFFEDLKELNREKGKTLLIPAGIETMLIICMMAANLNPTPILYFIFYNLLYGLVFSLLIPVSRSLGACCLWELCR